MSNAITKVYLLKVPLESDYKHTLYFANASDQQTYFQSKVVSAYSYSVFTYQRKDHIIRVPAVYDNICQCNYVMYQNTAYSNKWFYAFIDKIEYINDDRSDVHISTDVIQTWMFDYTIKTSFVEREHTNNDTVGANTVPEGLETGEYIQCTAPTKINNYDTGCYICVAVSEMFSEVTLNANDEKRVYNGIYSGLYYCICTESKYATALTNIYDKKGKADAIYSIFLIPKQFITDFSTASLYIGTSEGISFSFYMMQQSDDEVNLLNTAYKEVTRNSALAGSYVPRNNKLFTAEFNYMMLTNNAGGNITLNYEDFNAGTPRFKVVGTITTGCSIKCVPINYKILSDNNSLDNSYNFGLAGGKFPVCSWNSDAYTNWLTQNGINNAISTVTGVGQVVAGGLLLASGAGALVGGGLVVSGAMTIGEMLKRNYEHSLVPDQAKGDTSNGDINFSTDNLVFTVYQMSIKSEYANIIDGYFDMFGYKTHRVKVPNTNHRARWWFTKCVDVNIDGDIPNEDMQKIKNCYNNGITFWRNASEIQNYSLSNGIV